MSKKAKRPQAKQAPQRSPRLPGRIEQTLIKLQPLLARGEWDAAITQLEELHRQFPANVVALTELVNACQAANYLQHYLRYSRKLYALQPDDGDVVLGLAGAYMTNDYLFASFHYLQTFLQNFPDHERAAEVRQSISKIETGLTDLLTDLGTTGAAGFALGDLHDRLRAASELGDFAGARQIGRQLLDQYPEFVPALNNLSQIEFVEGNSEQALAYTRRVLSLQPDNFQASANLTRYLLLMGQVEAAQAQAAHLAAIQTSGSEFWVKQAETFTYLRDDQRVDAAVRAAEREPTFDHFPGAGFLYHLGGVAALGLGDEKLARKRWQKALQLDPELSIARENLSELLLPPWQRYAPYPFALQQWLPATLTTDLQQRLEKKRGNQLVRELQSYLAARPALLVLFAALLQRGNKAGREFVLGIARFSEYPPLFALLYDFATSQAGPDAVRGNALNLLNEFGQLPAPLTKMWVQGQWSEMMTMNFAIGEESEVEFPIRSRQAEKLLVEAIQLRNSGDLRAARAQLEKANALEPDHPAIINNLAACLEGQGDGAGAAALMAAVLAKHPDYLFGQVGLAHQVILAGELERARASLDPLLKRKKLHYGEFFALADSEIRYQFAQKQVAGVESWLEMWRKIEPEHPNLHYWERQFALHKGNGAKNAD